MSVVYEKIVAEDLELGFGSATRTAPGGGTMIGTKINTTTFMGTTPTVNFGDPDTDGSWRIIVDGVNLNVECRESGSWVAKGVFIP
jgi:hypothetical protein